MKLLKTLGVAVLVCLSTVTLSGCGSPDKLRKVGDLFVKAQPFMSKQEKVMLMAFNSRYNFIGYENLFKTIVEVRKDTFNISDSAVNNPVPFCDVLPILEVSEDRWSNNVKSVTPLGQWKKKNTGESLRTSCSKAKAMKHKNTNKQNTETITIKDKNGHSETLLSPAKIREVTQAAKECTRAKVNLLSLTKENRYLTVGDYEAVTKLILDCENLKMQIELNK